MSTNKAQRECSKHMLVEKIKTAQKSLSIIGATVFELDWDDLLKDQKDKNGKVVQRGLAWKFFNEGFTIHILRESETLIAQYVLLSQGVSEESTGSYSRGNLNGVREDIIKVLKNGLIDYARNNGIKDGIKGVGLEPVEDVYKKELNKLSDKTIRFTILEAIKINGLENKLIKDIDEAIANYFDVKLNEFADDLNGRVGWKKANPVIMELSQFLDNLVKKIAPIFHDFDELVALDIESILRKQGIALNDLNFSYVIDGAEQSVNFVTSIQSKIHDAIHNFTALDVDDDISGKIEDAKEQAEKAAARAVATEVAKYSSNAKTAQRLFIKDCYMPIPVTLIKIDDELFITQQTLTKFDSIDKFQYVGDINSAKWDAKKTEPYRSYWIDDFQHYYKKYFDAKISNGVQKYSTEETKKGDRKEVIDIFNESRVRIGSGPRDAFLSNMAIVKSVVWALIFDRSGRMLIHQRASNAKDNRGLWDKSVGGHVGVEDLDTIDAIKREIAEELYTLENEGQGGHDKIDWLITNKNKIIYLGDWKTGRYPDLKQLHLNSDEYYAFSLNYADINKRNFRTEFIFTERVLPSGKAVKAKCFVDPYLCVVAEDFDISKLQNSKYAMLTPNELKTCVDTGKIRINRETRMFDPTAKPMDFKVTSDLGYLVGDSIWDDVVTEFSRRIKDSFNEG